MANSIKGKSFPSPLGWVFQSNTYGCNLANFEATWIERLEDGTLVVEGSEEASNDSSATDLRTSDNVNPEPTNSNLSASTSPSPPREIFEWDLITSPEMRKIAEPFADRAFAIATSKDGIESPSGVFRQALFDSQGELPTSPSTSMLYAIFLTQNVDKIGATSNINGPPLKDGTEVSRRSAYAKKLETEFPELFILTNLDSGILGRDGGDDLETVYAEFTNAVINCPSTPSAIKATFLMIRDDEADRLGFPKKIISYLLEFGAQRNYKYGPNLSKSYTSPLEFLSFSEKEAQARRDNSNQCIQDIVASGIDFEACTGEVHACLSWETLNASRGKLSVKVIITEAILECKSSYQYKSWDEAKQHRPWVDPLAFPALRNIPAETKVTVDQIYSVAYTILEIMIGREYVRMLLLYKIQSKGMLLLDDNSSVCFPNGMLEDLVEELGFVLYHITFENRNILSYQHPTGAIVFLHSTLGEAADSRGFATLPSCLERLQIAKILNGLVQYKRNVELVSNVSSRNLQEAGEIFEIVLNNLQMGKKHASCLFRQKLLPPGVNAITKSELTKANEDSDYPIFRNDRRQFMGYANSKGTGGGRSNDNFITTKARNKLSALASKDKSTLIEFAELLSAFFKEDGSDQCSERWGRFLGSFEAYKETSVACAEAFTLLSAAYNTVKANAGNTLEREGQTRLQRMSNEEEFLAVIPIILEQETDKKYFYCPMDKDSRNAGGTTLRHEDGQLFDRVDFL